MRRYHFRWVLFIAISWTIMDVIWIRFFQFANNPNNENPVQFTSLEAMSLRGIIVFLMSGLMGYILIFKLRQAFRDASLLFSLLVKTSILLVASLVMNFLLHVTYSFFILHLTFIHGLSRFFGYASSITWLLHHSIGWIFLFLMTQLMIEFYEKYSPGVFWDILIGTYIRPKVQKRIIMFLDLKDSTPLAEKLQSEVYFSFIRDFIYYVSIALLEYDGRIYQYVGDEIVVSWMYTAENRANCIKALALSDRLIKRNSNYFKRRYGFIPEFKAGIHTGEVTVGEIGIIKKDIAMSGDIMNTTARIRTACTELNYNYIVSKDFLDGNENGLSTESLGPIELKGKSESIELFALKI
jgi:adenylate cyclase